MARSHCRRIRLRFCAHCCSPSPWRFRSCWRINWIPSRMAFSSAALLCAACLPVLLSANTRLLDELMRALLMAGVFMAVLAVRQKTVALAYLSSVAFALAARPRLLLAAFAGLGAGIGALLLAPKRKRGGWAFAMVADGVIARCRLVCFPRADSGGVAADGNQSACRRGVCACDSDASAARAGGRPVRHGGAVLLCSRGCGDSGAVCAGLFRRRAATPAGEQAGCLDGRAFCSARSPESAWRRPRDKVFSNA